MNHLSLFTGAGGGELAALLLGWRTIGYVEQDDYCQRIIAQRIKDGILHEAPIFGDIRAFISEGYAARYCGMVDVISGGFPCQPFSVAGRQAGESDPRNMWPSTLECIRIVRPRFAFLENVPGLLASGYCSTIFRDLAEAGFNARWCVLGASDCGGDHKRGRFWILAHPPGFGWNLQKHSAIGVRNRWNMQDQIEPRCRWKRETRGSRVALRWKAARSRIDREHYELADSVDRLKAIGNGQVPIVAATAWRLLTGTTEKEPKK